MVRRCAPQPLSLRDGGKDQAGYREAIYECDIELCNCGGGFGDGTQAVAQITFFEREGFGGRSFTAERGINNFDRHGFNDRASSAVVQQERWEVCQDARYKGRCVVLRSGRYPSLAAMGLNDRVSSVRKVDRDVYLDEHRYAPVPETSHNDRRGRNERLYQAEVTYVHAVGGPPEQRCWVEREQVLQPGASANVPGAIAGALMGGILGHQIGGGRGQDLATAGGVVAGAVVGSKVGLSTFAAARQAVTRR